MDELEATISELLSRELAGSEVRFDPYPGYGKLHGAIIWDGFAESEQLERQHRVWDVLRPALSEEQRFATGFLLTVTPDEWNAVANEWTAMVAAN
jgi:acid stress-induced BolA-like protein IbaG/YrbA